MVHTIEAKPSSNPSHTPPKPIKPDLSAGALTALRDSVDNTATRARLFQALNPSSPETAFAGNRASAACTYMAKLEVAEGALAARIQPHVQRVLGELEAWLERRGT